jgi:hypothetical protein
MNLSLNEQLLRDTKDAHVCIFIANLASWLRTNIDREKFEHRNIRDGRCWSYSTIKDYQNYFDFWSVRNIRTIIKHCQQAGLIEIGNYNKHKYDKTTWYTLTDKALEYYPILRDKIRSRLHKSDASTDLSEVTKGFVASDKPIPENTTTSSNNTITTNRDLSAAKKSDRKKETEKLMLALIAVYREVFPNNPQPHSKLIATSLYKTLQSLIASWPEADPVGNPLTVEAFKRYMIGLRTLAPKFSLGEYTTADGNKKKNGMETFCRWNTLVKFLENQYS